MAHPTRRIGEHDETVRAQERAAFSEFLLTARRQAALSLDEIATVTRVPARHLDALEQGRIGDLPRGVYRRAIVRTYASAVGLDPSLVLERFSQAFGADAAFAEWEVVPAATAARTLPSARPTPKTVAAEPVTVVSTRRSAPVAAAPPALQVHRRTILAVIACGLLLLAAAFWLRPTPVVVEAPGVAPSAPAVPVSAGAETEPTVETVSSTTADVASPLPPAASTQPATTPGVTSPADDTDLQVSPVQLESQLVVTSTPPGARVTVDGVGWGVTPITIRHLPPGVKRIRVTMDGYVGQEREVRIGEDGGVVSARVTLQPRN